MKQLFFKSLVAVASVIFITSCGALHTGYMSNSAALSSANFAYVKQNIQGEAKATYILGIGGLSKETLVNEAKQNMLKTNPLQTNQALVNLTVNFKLTYYLGVYSQVKCIVTADVVEFK